jgi:hypothetical protein
LIKGVSSASGERNNVRLEVENVVSDDTFEPHGQVSESIHVGLSQRTRFWKEDEVIMFSKVAENGSVHTG